MYEYLKNLKQPDGPLMVMEFWTGWFDHWGEKHHVWPIQGDEKHRSIIFYVLYIHFCTFIGKYLLLPYFYYTPDYRYTFDDKS